MKTKHLVEPSQEIKSILAESQDEGLHVSLASGEEFLILPIDDFDIEIAQQRKSKALMELLNERGKCREGISLDEAKRKLGLL